MRFTVTASDVVFGGVTRSATKTIDLTAAANVIVVSLFTSNGAGGVTFMSAGAAPNPQFEDNQDGTIKMVVI